MGLTMSKEKRDKLNALQSQLQQHLSQYNKMDFHKTRIITEKELSLRNKIEQLKNKL